MAEDMKGAVAWRGRQIGWRSVGSGPPLLLLNGYAGTAADWDPNFLGALAEGFEVVLPDNRGMGTSTWGDGAEPLTIGSMADDVLVLADELSLSSFALVGWSMGGFIAQTVAARAAQRVTGMALLATDPGGPSTVFADPEVWARLTDSSGTEREQATRLLEVLFPPELAAELDGLVGQLVADARATIDHDVLRAQEAAIQVWHEAAPLPIPDGAPRTLVACGALDAVIPPANAGLLADRWSATMPITYEGCGHALMAQVPFDLAAQLTAFLG
jgi:pimeloyl-ACP methyl ester carboxylesterase